MRYRPLPLNMLLPVMTVFAISIFLAFTQGCYMRPKPPKNIRVLFTSETQGMFTPCGCVGGPRGGFERRATAIKEARESAPGSVILLDTGNFSTGVTTDSERLKAEYVTQAMAALDYDAVSVGLRDAKRPRLGVLTYSSEGCPLTSAGYSFIDKDNEEPDSYVLETTDDGNRKLSFPSHITLELNGYKIGIVGSPLSDLRPEVVGFQNEPDVRVEELYHLMENISSNEGIGTFIVISDTDATWQTTNSIASHIPLATILIGGQPAPSEFTEEKSASEIETWPIVIPKAATWGRSLGILDLEMTPLGGISKYSLRYVDLNEDVEKDPPYSDITEQYLADISEVGATAVPQIRNTGFVGSENCKGCHLPEFEQWQTTRHATAWESLEETGRLRESTCVPCHTTGYAGLEMMPDRLVPHEFRGVGCESCHGPGLVHIQFQEWKIYGTIQGEVRGEDLTDPIVRTPPESSCTPCHIPPHDEGWLYPNKIIRVRHN